MSRAAIRYAKAVLSLTQDEKSTAAIQEDMQSIIATVDGSAELRMVLNSPLIKSEVKYLIVDLNTPNIDKTPEKTLNKKFHKLMHVLKDNPKIKLLSTNRIMKRIQDGKEVMVHDMWDGERAFGGSYAIYRIN